LTPSIDEILNVLRERGIEPHEQLDDVDVPGIGEIKEGETIYTTSMEEVLEDQDDERFIEDDRLRRWWHEIEKVSETKETPTPSSEPPEPQCAWYCPIHFFGHSWGIYIRESCILSTAINIARFVDWQNLPVQFKSRQAITKQLLRSAFYVYYLHEHFHHKVESLGFRLLITTGSDRYRPYKANVYRTSFRTPQCLEESLANAESYRRLSEARYRNRLATSILYGLRSFLEASFPLQPPGYAQAMNFLGDSRYRNGLYVFQSQVLEGKISPITPPLHWSVAPNSISSLMRISDDIYVVLPRGGHPIFNPTSIDPGATASTSALVGALTKHYDYQQTSGGKGSHVKLTKQGAPNVHIPGNRSVVSPGVVKHVLKAIGGYPISRLPDFLKGKLG